MLKYIEGETMDCEKCQKCIDKKEGCRRCFKKGKSVSFDTVLSLTKPYLKNTLTNDRYYLCTNPNCDVAYYTLTGRCIEVKDVDCDIWYKKEKQKFMVCYCRDISLDDVVFAVSKLEICTIPKIIHFLQKDNVQTDCIHKNPTGESCARLFLNAIEYAKKIKLIK